MPVKKPQTDDNIWVVTVLFELSIGLITYKPYTSYIPFN